MSPIARRVAALEAQVLVEPWEPARYILPDLRDVLPPADLSLLLDIGGRVDPDAPPEAWLGACRSWREHDRMTAILMELEAADMLDQALRDAATSARL